MHAKLRSWAPRWWIGAVALTALAGCAQGDEGVGDTGVDPNAEASVDTGTPMMDAAIDTGLPSRDAGVHDQGTHPDTGVDTGVTLTVDVPIVPNDTGAPRVCTAGCATDGDCQSTCPIASSGSIYCCSGGGSGSTGTCYAAGGSCPVPVPDSGVVDTGVPPPVDAGTGGGRGAICTMSNQCGSGGANCCIPVAGGAGFCGCSNALFGCLPC